MRKFKADYLFTGKEMAEAGSVLVINDQGAVETILPAAEAGEGVESFAGLLTPGFVNCHCHLELSHMKGVLPERTGLVDFLLSVIRGRGATTTGATDSSPSGILNAITAAEDSMLHNGIVAVGDICNTTLTLPQKAEGRLFYHNFIETMGFIEHSAPDRYAASVNIYKDFAEAYTLPIEANSLVPHAPYSVSTRLFQMIANFPGNHLLTIHNQESADENVFSQTGQGNFLRLYQGLGLDTSFFKGTGKRSLAAYLPHFYKNQTILLVHNVDTREEDLQWWAGWRDTQADPDKTQPAAHPGKTDPAKASRGVPNLYFCLCPNANLYISGQLPDVDLLQRYGCDIVLGTDSLASNHQLDILEEMKTLQGYFPDLSTATLLQWATSNGAKALQLDGVLGTFAPGKQPGVVLIEGMENGRLTRHARPQRLI
ncbi:MAG TPA: amidohydrolase family protein [Puia sp.]|nr:amidohydrolase family protein [Puia sp.]